MATSFVLELAGLRAEAALAAVEWAAAADHAATVLRTDGAVSSQARCGALRVLALVRARRGDPGVWPLLDEALILAQDLRQLAPVAAARAEVAWLEGQRWRIAGETAGAFTRARAEGAEVYVGELARWRRRAGLQDRVTPARAACAYGAALALADRGERDGLQQAFDALRDLGAHAAARIVARRLAEHGVRGLPRGPYGATRSNPGGLTSRELEVLALVSEGLRDVEISERLVVSPKTVGHHVSAILRKLDVSNRTAAAHCLRLAA
jgi:DNA-binding CsgD family transcriptional regulator